MWDQEGLPAYWGIETFVAPSEFDLFVNAFIRKDYPLTGVLKLPMLFGQFGVGEIVDQEGLPAYWGIETNILLGNTHRNHLVNQEGLPAYWGIETHSEQT